MNVLDIGQGEAVMLGHSYLWDADMWQPQIEALSKQYRVIVPELWGHGSSDALPAGTAGMADLASQHLAVMDALGIARCAVIGLSVGGMWGAEMALIAPDRVSALALVATSLAAEPQASHAQYFAMLDIVEAAASLPEGVRNAIVPLFFSPEAPARRPDLIARFEQSLRDWPSGSLVDSVVPLGRIIFGRRDALADLPRINCPCLVVTGEGDRARPPIEGARMAELLDAPFVAIPGAGHIASLEAPDAVTDVLERFLAEAI